MVHVKKCPRGKRGKPIIEFYRRGEPQVYCMGQVNPFTGRPLAICQSCADYFMGDQCLADFDRMIAETNLV